MLTRRRFLKLVLSGIVAGAAFIGFPVTEAMATPRITRYAFRPPNWTRGLNLKIVVLSDFHACEPWMTAERVGAICAQANALQPDLILLLGDYVAATQFVTGETDPASWAHALAELKAPLGVHAIMGNHDYWHDLAFQRDPARPALAETALRNAGIPVYINEAVRLDKDGHPFWLAGLGDQLAMRSHGLDDLSGTLGQITDMAPVVLLAHEPDIFPQVPERVQLTLSGHTHGGQVNFFGWAPIVPSRFGRRYLGGHIVENGNHIIVSRGLGCTGLPVRFGAWPEIVEIDLG
ncbi:metallophosphoesterase [Rhizobium sp. KVB221]|uniref:Metallophosphoesterase n=1 Tax=Rhizobium setariae TaxID=2801340 RepID=A0A937CRI9_9HYPH|nr:metallophosphoesterase [Rhizobium setariae]MBL0374632.1 metallophosphoesterase [Rhizobium setariae]